jgi:succinate dehydrogenase/fumarate reductase flavoprotein subunit
MQPPSTKLHTLIIGSGAAGLNAALQLESVGITDIAILTEGLNMGTSINTGSDKQTYYKLGLYGDDHDSPIALAKTFLASGGMHGDLALVEAALSTRAFFNLVNLGVGFPRDCYGQFVGYKTDHDPLRRATSSGPYTSRDMCRALIAEVKRRNIAILENRNVVSLLTVDDNGEKRTAGAIAIKIAENDEVIWEIYQAENIIFATGGPGGLYQSSVYPQVHTGAIGLGLAIGARARNLSESQFGIASTKFRWNVSGSYMQVIPRFISTAADGVSDEHEFLAEIAETPGVINSLIFLKGYQWPFDVAKVTGDSSLIDILVYRETVIRGRRVWLDFRRNSEDFILNELSTEAFSYLEQSDALQATPLERLRMMNPAAIKLYEEHGIHLAVEPLEIAVCAQHNNGGLAGNIWWESENIKHFFPIGEVNGSHGICRPGGSALNSGQVGGFRAAEYIAAKYSESTLDDEVVATIAQQKLQRLQQWCEQSSRLSRNIEHQLKGKCLPDCNDRRSKLLLDAQNPAVPQSWQEVRRIIQERMSRAGALIRSADMLHKAVVAAWDDYSKLVEYGCTFANATEQVEALRNLQLCLSHAVYLDAVSATVDAGVGSRGSAILLALAGRELQVELGSEWNFIPENGEFRDRILVTGYNGSSVVEHNWEPCRTLPQADDWFETAWSDYQKGEIYE